MSSLSAARGALQDGNFQIQPKALITICRGTREIRRRSLELCSHRRDTQKVV
jgi:hypothetical protein